MSRRVVLGVCAIGVGTLLLSACDGFRAASANFSDSAEITQSVAAVRIENGSGTIRIRVGGSPSVRRTVYYMSDKPGQTHRFEGDTLVLEDCRKSNCSVDYEVTLPAAAKVAGEVGSGEIDIVGMSEVGVRAGSGDIRVRDVPGPVTVNTSSGRVELVGIGQSAVVEGSSGDIVLTNVKGDLTVQARSAAVTATGIGGKASVDSSSGDVRVDMATAQNVKVKASSGSINVTVPRGELYKADVTTDSGERNININTGPEGKHVLDLNASSGDILVNYR